MEDLQEALAAPGLSKSREVIETGTEDAGSNGGLVEAATAPQMTEDEDIGDIEVEDYDSTEGLQETLEAPNLSDRGELIAMDIENEVSITSDLPGEEKLFGWDPSLDHSRPVDDEMGEVDATAMESAHSANDEEFANPEPALPTLVATEEGDAQSPEATQRFPPWHEDKIFRDSLKEPHRSVVEQHLKKLRSPARKTKAAEQWKMHRSKDEEKIAKVWGGRLETSRPTVCPYQLRTYSLESGGSKTKTVGLSVPGAFIPRAHVLGVNQFSRIEDIPKVEGGRMFGNHLRWADPLRTSDGTDSWTNTPLFALQHAIGRHEKGERGVYIAGGETSKLLSLNGTPAKIYPAPEVLNAFDIMSLSWKEAYDDTADWAFKLHERKFTHESLSFGETRDREGAVIHVPFEDLVSNGLFLILPELRIEGPYKRCGLYESLLALRAMLFTNVTAPGSISRIEILVSAGLAKLYMRDFDNGKIPLYALLWFLSLRKHDIAASTCYAEWILAHYQVEDVKALYFEHMERVPDNLQERVEFMALKRRAAEIFGVEDFPDTVLVPYSKYNKNILYAGEDRIKHKRKPPRRHKGEKDREAELMMDIMEEFSMYDYRPVSKENRQLLAKRLCGKTRRERIKILEKIVEDGFLGNEPNNETVEANGDATEEEEDDQSELSSIDEGDLDDLLDSTSHPQDAKRKRADGDDSDENHTAKRPKLSDTGSDKSERAKKRHRKTKKLSTLEKDLEQMGGQLLRRVQSRLQLGKLHKAFLANKLPALEELEKRDDWVSFGSAVAGGEVQDSEGQPALETEASHYEEQEDEPSAEVEERESNIAMGA